MVESRYVLHGLVSGVVSGIVMGIITFIYMPPIEEVMKTVERYVNTSGVGQEVIRGYLSIALMLSPIIVFVFSLLLGALFGALYEYIDKKIRTHVIVSAIVTGAIFWAILVVPNMAMGAGSGKIVTNSIWAATYTITLLILAVLRSPRASNE